jgi:glyoxylase-like metal-dependent hydrolase (beta-lactamase superfamily II)
LEDVSAAIDALGRRPEAIRAVIVTHHHAGTAERLRSTAGSRVLVGEADGNTGMPHPRRAAPDLSVGCPARPAE